MNRIWKETGFVEDDPWTIEAEGAGGAATNSRVIRRFSDFLELAEKATERGEAMAVLVEPAETVARLAPHLDRLALIALAFPAFNDGRAFSHATLLRTRHGFHGEIRAIGDVLIDQIPLMLRCGIDSFLVSDAVALKRLEEGRLTGIPLHYQPAARPAAGTSSYSWRRSSRSAA